MRSSRGRDRNGKCVSGDLIVGDGSFEIAGGAEACTHMLRSTIVHQCEVVASILQVKGLMVHHNGCHAASYIYSRLSQCELCVDSNSVSCWPESPGRLFIGRVHGRGCCALFPALRGTEEQQVSRCGCALAGSVTKFWENVQLIKSYVHAYLILYVDVERV